MSSSVHCLLNISDQMSSVTLLLPENDCQGNLTNKSEESMKTKQAIGASNSKKGGGGLQLLKVR